MLFPLDEPLDDADLEAVLATALRTAGGLTREAECWLATVCARSLANRLAILGLRVVRVPDRPPLTE